MNIAVIVPTLDEEERLRRHLPALVAVADEVIVSDGGSSDRSRAVAAELGARVVDGPRGRGTQLNRGAAAASAGILLFVHADTDLGEGAVKAVREAIAAGHAGGGFLVRFDAAPPIFRLGSWIVNLRTRLTRAPLGDQAQFVRREVFEELSGYREWPILEDLEFIRRLRRRGSIAVLEPPVKTSGRRFVRQGITRTIVTNWLIWLLYSLGVSPHRLARMYKVVR